MDAAQANIETLDRTLEHLLAGRLDEALGYFEEEARWGVSQFLPEAGLHVGREAIAAMLAARRERFPGGYTLRRLNVWGTPDHVFAEYTRGPAGEQEEGEHVALLATVVYGRLRDVREFVYALR